jgi:hypothetical protein
VTSESPPRSRAQRRRDTEYRLGTDIDVWVASASADGAPYLVPLSFDWDGEALLMATPTDSPTGRNLAATRTVRVGLGGTRDVTMTRVRSRCSISVRCRRGGLIGSSLTPASTRAN